MQTTCKVQNFSFENMTLCYPNHFGGLINIDGMLDLGIYINNKLSFKSHN